jgi:hypothetical protein
MSILPLIIIVGTLIAVGFGAKTLVDMATDYGNRKKEGKK